jgi:hypothetical protein
MGDLDMGILARSMVCLGQDPAEFTSFRGERAMANDDKPQKHKPDELQRAKAKAGLKPSTERPFDMWLQKQLHAMYDEIASEPLPTDLLNLIETDAGKSKK